MKVENITSPKSGKPVANQFVITQGTTEWFQSYETMIAKQDIYGNNLVLDMNYWDYSRTTSKYRNQFTGLTTKETKELIASGEIKLENLNV